jgi:predicted nucleic acid-binding protein
MLYLDTNILIYLLEGHPYYGDKVADELERQVQSGEAPITSTITIVEFLAGTNSKNQDILRQVPRLQFIMLNIEIAEQAALMQKNEKLLIGDAIHLASALGRGVDMIYTNDKLLAKVAGRYLRVKTLDT